VQPVEFSVGSEVLRGALWSPTGKSKGALLLAHGFNSNLEEFGRTPEWLAAEGFHALAFDQRGFGLSDGERGRTGVDRAVQDLAAAASFLQERLGGKVPLGLVGHSLGGAYVVASPALRDPPAPKVGFVHPVDCMFDEVPLVLRPGYHLMGRLGKWRMARGRPAGRMPYNSSSRRLFVSVEAARQSGRPDFILRHSNLANYEDAKTMRASDWAREVHQPVLVVTSPHDRVVKPRHIQDVYEALAGPKRIVEHRGGHSSFRDLDGRVVTDALARWFDLRLHPGGT
jgi:acylglycerol lipase